MGIRGAYGFYINGMTKVAYNQFDSYPQHLGQHILDDLRGRIADPDTLIAQAQAIRLVSEKRTPTKEDIAQFREFANLKVSNQVLTDWYCLLREMQGRIDLMLAHGICLDARKFLDDSLFCEWAYIVNCDDRTLEVYQGFVKTPGTGRYMTPKPKAWKPRYKGESYYYPVTLVATFPWDELPAQLDPALVAAGALECADDPNHVP